MRRARAWRFFGLRLLVRKVAGLVLAVAGIGLLVETLPTYLWLGLLGFVFIWCGWVLYGVDRRRWI